MQQQQLNVNLSVNEVTAHEAYFALPHLKQTPRRAKLLAPQLSQLQSPTFKSTAKVIPRHQAINSE